MVIESDSACKVSRIVEELCSDAVPKSFVWLVFKTLDREIEARRSRRLPERIPYLIADAMYGKGSRRGGVRARR